MKPLPWLGDSLKRVRGFPAVAKQQVGYQLERVQADVGEAVMSDKLKRIKGSGNVFRDLGFGNAEAENLKLRAELMMRIDDYFRQSGLTQADAARQLGLTQPRMNALLKGRIELFSLDSLVNIAGRAGLSVRLVIRKAA